ncbi:ATP-grasp domain-containing protein [Micromonospora pallida]|uniref:ATP-grasp domain-containing protein n=1 Tax=Micromonospora pallida TaxID=145854 RepID=A0A1C6SDA6_9ACTN|nr:ATP-grasp domain-containing protein [Micromonospora pallida]
MLIVGGAVDGAGTECVRLAQAHGLRVIVTEAEEKVAGAGRAVELADLAVPLDRRDVDGHVAWATANAQREAIVGVYCFREYAVPTTAAVAEALGLPGSPVTSALLVRDKFRCRERLRAAGFPQPRGTMCTGPDDTVAFARRVAGPWVVKPNDAHGSLGVTVVHRAEDLPAAVDALPPAHRTSFLVEEFQPGDEYSAEGVFVDGEPRVLVLTRETPIRDTIVVEELTMPAPLPADLAARARRVVEDGLRAVGLSFGTFHVEFWIDGETVVLGEVHNRPAGAPRGMSIQMIEAVTGVNVHGVVFAQLLGRTPRLDREARAGAATLLDVYAPPGRVQAGLAVETVTADPTCLGLYVSVRPGDQVPPIRQAGDMPAVLVAVGESVEDSRKNAARLADLLSLTTQPPN